jgi:hypothetical protein
LDALLAFRVLLFLGNIPLPGMFASGEILSFQGAILEQFAPKTVKPDSRLYKPPGGPFILAVRQ